MCLLVTTVTPERIADITDMPYGMLTHVGPTNHLLYGGEIPFQQGHFW